MESQWSVENLSEKEKVTQNNNNSKNSSGNNNEVDDMEVLPEHVTVAITATTTVEATLCSAEGHSGGSAAPVPASGVGKNNVSEAVPTAVASEQADQKCFAQKLAVLQEKTKSLRVKLGFRRRELQQQAVAVAESVEVGRLNDRIAAQAMAALQASANKDNTPGTNSVSVTSKKTPHVAEFKNFQQRKTRRELQEQLDGLQELIGQLGMHSPELKERINHLAQNNPKLREMDMFQPSTSKAMTTRTRMRLHQDSDRSGGGGVKQRHESETSNASTTTSQKDTTITTTTTTTTTGNNDNGANLKATRKRGTRKKKNTVKPAKSQASELEALTKYINTIVGEYLGQSPEQKQRSEELEFKGTLADLEAHAQRLVQAGLGRIVEEEIRINRKNNRQSFITMSADREGPERDGIILLPVARRYAFEGDIVRAFVMNAGVATPVNSSNGTTPTEQKKKQAECPISGGKDNSFCVADDEDPFANDEDTESPDSDVDPNELDVSAVIVPDNCPKSFVIAIVQQTELRQIVGTISFKNATKLNDEQLYYKLKPHDMRVPMVYIPEACAAQITSENKGDVCGLLYLAQVRETDVNGHCIGELLQPVGKVGDLEAEMKAILLHNGLKDIRPYEQRFNEMFAQPQPPITEADLSQREDLRKKCVFTIDPLTARDLDDAVSLERLSDDSYEVGVHISDVSHYLPEDCELDNIVKKRATSIYLVNEVIHMLPQSLCFKCSLLPGEDKFAFSVFWQISDKGVLLDTPRFTRTVINSCAQLAYEHAQKIIDNPHEEFGEDDFPTICNGFTVADISARIKTLNNIAEQLRKKRFDGGALSINNPKLRFHLDPKTGEPNSYEVDGRQEANFLIEEYMLLANQSVARFIYDCFPDISILRHHAPPLSKSMKSLREKLASLGIDFDTSSSKTVYASMQRICHDAKDSQAMDACLSTLLTKPMARAKYFCSEGKTEEADLWHYALSIPIYTHFTSPIRRYPDILVHRVLAAALNYSAPPKRTPDELHELAKVCNDQKYNAKNAGDESINLFFKRYIKAQQSLTLRAVVTEIFQHLVNVVTVETGHAIGIHFKMQKVLVDTSNVPAYILISEKNSKNAPLKLQMFSTVDVKLVIWDEKICGFFVSPDPKQRQLNSIELSKKKQQQQNVNGAGSSNGENSGLARKQRRTSQETPSANQLNKSKSKPSVKSNEKRIYAVRDGE